jgi:hypothetical protein
MGFFTLSPTKNKHVRSHLQLSIVYTHYRLWACGEKEFCFMFSVFFTLHKKLYYSIWMKVSILQYFSFAYEN